MNPNNAPAPGGGAPCRRPAIDATGAIGVLAAGGIIANDATVTVSRPAFGASKQRGHDHRARRLLSRSHYKRIPSDDGFRPIRPGRDDVDRRPRGLFDSGDVAPGILGQCFDHPNTCRRLRPTRQFFVNGPNALVIVRSQRRAALAPIRILVPRADTDRSP